MFILEPYVHLCSIIETDVPCTSCCHCCADAVSAVLQSAKKRKKKSAGGEETENGAAAAEEPVQPSQTLIAESYTPPDPGPYPQDKPPENPVRFTPVQVHACTHTCTCLFALSSDVSPCTDLPSYTPMHPATHPPPPHPHSQPMARQPCLSVLLTPCISYPVTSHGPHC